MISKVKRALRLLLKEDSKQDKCPFCGADKWSRNTRIHDGCDFDRAIKILQELVRRER